MMKFLPAPKPTKADLEFRALAEFLQTYMHLEMNKAQRAVARFIAETKHQLKGN